VLPSLVVLSGHPPLTPSRHPPFQSSLAARPSSPAHKADQDGLLDRRVQCDTHEETRRFTAAGSHLHDDDTHDMTVYMGQAELQVGSTVKWLGRQANSQW
jgi:hypothetical protein